jgi:hypothetical protein
MSIQTDIVETFEECLKIKPFEYSNEYHTNQINTKNILSNINQTFIKNDLKFFVDVYCDGVEFSVNFLSFHNDFDDDDFDAVEPINLKYTYLLIRRLNIPIEYLLDACIIRKDTFNDIIRYRTS